MLAEWDQAKVPEKRKAGRILLALAQVSPVSLVTEMSKLAQRICQTSERRARIRRGSHSPIKARPM